ncbi:MAG: hypothetical protein MUF71_10835 [Candidatus Kapabacteria bacterium]|nr:hypothetical protein [Candidatus Kapabacteria bacterium]
MILLVEISSLNSADLFYPRPKVFTVLWLNGLFSSYYLPKLRNYRYENDIVMNFGQQ